jgi:hypothetical protein
MDVEGIRHGRRIVMAPVTVPPAVKVAGVVAVAAGGVVAVAAVADGVRRVRRFFGK